MCTGLYTENRCYYITLIRINSTGAHMVQWNLIQSQIQGFTEMDMMLKCSREKTHPIIEYGLKQTQGQTYTSVWKKEKKSCSVAKESKDAHHKWHNCSLCAWRSCVQCNSQATPNSRSYLGYAFASLANEPKPQQTGLPADLPSNLDIS